ncbi:MAG: mandelate racemase/muconate lactonizing enzyme family protein [Acidobacteriaceae bacterium]
MKVTDIKTQIVNLNFRNAVIVKIETDEGVTGLAEAVMKRRTQTIERSILDLKQYLLGKDPTEIESHWERMYRDSFWVGGPLHSTSISAIDCALWDILGKSCGLPVYKLLGGPTRTRVPVYCHCSAGNSPEAFASNVKACKARGYQALKTTLPLFYGEGNRGGDRHAVNGSGYSGTQGMIDSQWKETEYLDPSIFSRIREFFIAAREAAGPEFGIALDCHGRLNPKAALRLCRALEDLNLLFVEEPVPPESVEELSLVQRETTIPIAAGERWATIYGVRPFLEKHAVDYLQCDLVNCGGITGLKKIAALAEAHYIGMAPHNPNGPLATVMNLHYAAAIPNFFILETIGSDADEKLAAEMLTIPLRPYAGALELPTGAGFGVDLAQEALDARPYMPYAGHR